MIRQVIFDVGGVLMDFDTHALTRALTTSEEDALLLHAETFDHPDWLRTDRGGCPVSAVIDAMKSHLPPRLHGAVDELMARWDDWLAPREDIDLLAQELDRLGYPMYILSNTSETFYRFRSRIPCWPKIRGVILSFEEKVMKPDPEIYRRLFSRFGLAPGECFFVDDSHLNIEAAHWCGMKGQLFRGDISELRAALRAEGVPVQP
jgi:putative hydrolase of the HAD superfamily